ncbi:MULTISPECIES: hypothetical protein [Burkholderia]|jgi:hypothetical protein|uniref:hypothetical protein n=1 Tax=Burkholderia TaxID=32008 RepID=UPI000F5213E4|nr:MULTISPECIES: hypothetical protein [Burkholderia]NBI48038.1 hypothetical protein [Burkholderia sp. ISTR5]
MIAQRKPNNDKGFKDFHPDFAGSSGRCPHFCRVATSVVKRRKRAFGADVGFCQRQAGRGFGGSGQVLPAHLPGPFAGPFDCFA